MWLVGCGDGTGLMVVEKKRNGCANFFGFLLSHFINSAASTSTHNKVSRLRVWIWVWFGTSSVRYRSS